MKKIIITILIFCLFANPVYATNTYSTVLVEATSQYWSITDANQTGLDITGDISLEAWVYFTTLPVVGSSGGTAKVISKWLGSGNQRSYTFGVNGAGATNCYIWFYITSNGSDTTYWSSDTAITQENTWIHIAVTLDVSAKDATFYLNGSADGGGQPDGGTATSIYNSSAIFEISGLNNGGEHYIDGYVDDARVWNDIRTSTEIGNNYNCSLAGTETNLQAYWRFDNNGNDSHSNGNNLTNNNTVTFQSTTLPFTNTCGGGTVEEAPKKQSEFWF